MASSTLHVSMIDMPISEPISAIILASRDGLESRYPFWLCTMLSTKLHASIVQIDDVAVCLQEQEWAQAGLH